LSWQLAAGSGKKGQKKCFHSGMVHQVVNTPQKRRKTCIKKFFSFQRKKLLFFLFFDVKKEKQQ
jgi:hypothetical protein